MFVQRFSVPIEYPVAFTRDVFDENNETLVSVISRSEGARRQRVLVVLDGGIAAARPKLAAEIDRYFRSHDDRLQHTGPPELVPGGEACKNDPACVSRMLARIHHDALDRQSVIVVVGGGAVLDLVGYGAALSHRGVRLVRVPSTVLAQADSGVAVKNGVNAFGEKNYLGTFAAPYGVVIDSTLLDTLTARDLAAGTAEAVKVALVRDAEFFTWLFEAAGAIRSGDKAALAELVERSCRLHARHVETSGDPFEVGSARPLDFGHWAAHKLETLTSHELRHGEAVAIGVALDAVYSEAARITNEAGIADAVIHVLTTLGLPVWHDALQDPRLMAGLDDFRRHLGGELTISMLVRPGTAIDVNTIDQALMQGAIGTLRERARRAGR